MAEDQTSRPRRRRRTKAQVDAEGNRESTRRMVLERVRALVIPDDATDAMIAQARDVLRANEEPNAGADVFAWLEVGEYEGSKRGAIEAYAGKAGTPEARVGAFKAPPARGWAGGRVHTAPPQPRIEGMDLE